MKSSPCFSSPSCNCTAQSFTPPLDSAAEQHTHAYLCSWAWLQIALPNCKWKCPTLLLCEQLFISSQAKPNGGLTVYIRKRVTPVVQCILWPRGDFGCIYFSSCLCGEETHIWIADNQASLLNRGLRGCHTQIPIHPWYKTACTPRQLPSFPPPVSAIFLGALYGGQKKYSILAFNLKTFFYFNVEASPHAAKTVLITGVLVVKNHHCGRRTNKVNLQAQSLLYFCTHL